MSWRNSTRFENCWRRVGFLGKGILRSKVTQVTRKKVNRTRRSTTTAAWGEKGKVVVDSWGG